MNHGSGLPCALCTVPTVVCVEEEIPDIQLGALPLKPKPIVFGHLHRGPAIHGNCHLTYLGRCYSSCIHVGEVNSLVLLTHLPVSL